MKLFYVFLTIWAVTVCAIGYTAVHFVVKYW